MALEVEGTVWIRRSRWRSGNRARVEGTWRRGPLLSLAAVIVATLGTGAAAVAAWRQYGADDPNRWAAVGAVGALGAVLLASIAGVVATVAYQLSSQRPKLVPQLWQPQPDNFVQPLGEPIVLCVDHEGKPPPEHLPDGIQLLLRRQVLLRVVNEGPVSARNVTIRVVLSNLAWHADYLPLDWRPDPVATSRAWGTQSISWEGGADLAIHSLDDRWLGLDFNGLWGYCDGTPDRDKPSISIEVVADGFSRDAWPLLVSVTG